MTILAPQTSIVAGHAIAPPAASGWVKVDAVNGTQGRTPIEHVEIHADEINYRDADGYTYRLRIRDQAGRERRATLTGPDCYEHPDRVLDQLDLPRLAGGGIKAGGVMDALLEAAWQSWQGDTAHSIEAAA